MKKNPLMFGFGFFPSHWRVLSVKLRELITLALKGPRVPHLWISMSQSTASKHTSNSTSKARLCQYGHWDTLINNKSRSYHKLWRRRPTSQKQVNLSISSDIAKAAQMQLFSYICWSKHTSPEDILSHSRKRSFKRPFRALLEQFLPNNYLF